MLLSIYYTDQGGFYITRDSGCFNPRNNFVQAIAEIEKRTYNYQASADEEDWRYRVIFRDFRKWLSNIEIAIKDPSHTITYIDFCTVAEICDNDKVSPAKVQSN